MNEGIHRTAKFLAQVCSDVLSSLLCIALAIWLIRPHREDAASVS